MGRADGWFICRIGFVEIVRAVGFAAGQSPIKAVRREWPAFGVVEVDQALVDRAATLAIKRNLRSLDSIHLAAALLLPVPELVLATWDQHLHEAARAEGLRLLPASLISRRSASLR
jgi:predicted nucleic acid-binding protein